MSLRTEIRPDDLIPAADYARTRSERRRALAARKKLRRVDVGPHITFYFENYDTMWLQVQEMLHIEKGGPEQVADELAAYNPLIPQGNELVATFMVEIDEPIRRKRVLMGLGGIETTASLRIGDDVVAGEPETDADRTSAEGKASSVQFVHFRLTPSQAAAFRTPNTQVLLGLAHPNYSHLAVLPEPVRAELAGDLG